MKHIKIYEDFLNEAKVINEGATIESAQYKQKQIADKAIKEVASVINSIAKKYPPTKEPNGDAYNYAYDKVREKMQELYDVLKKKISDKSVYIHEVLQNGWMHLYARASKNDPNYKIDNLGIDPSLADDLSDFFWTYHTNKFFGISRDPNRSMPLGNFEINIDFLEGWNGHIPGRDISFYSSENIVSLDGIDAIIDACKSGLVNKLEKAGIEWTKYVTLIEFKKWMDMNPERSKIRAIENKWPIDPMPRNWDEVGQVVRDANAYSYEDLLLITNDYFSKPSWVKKGGTDGPRIWFTKSPNLWFYMYDRDNGEWVGGYENQKRPESNQAPMNLMQFMKLISREI